VGGGGGVGSNQRVKGKPAVNPNGLTLTA